MERKMRNTYRTEQSGRSMIEMLAVLAIVGILSVAGIAGYSKAMGKFKQQKLADQISTVVANIRTMYAGQGNYAGLTAANAITYGLIPVDMVSGATIAHATGGLMQIVPTVAADPVAANIGFKMAIDGIDKDTCMYLATSDWGSGTSGLIRMSVGTGAAAAATAALATEVQYTQANLPISLANASTGCACVGASTCGVAWLFL